MSNEVETARDYLATLAAFKENRAYVSCKRGAPGAPVSADVLDIETFAGKQLRQIAKRLSLPAIPPSDSPTKVANTILASPLAEHLDTFEEIRHIAESVTASVCEYLTRATRHSYGRSYHTAGRIVNLLKAVDKEATVEQIRELYEDGETEAFNAPQGRLYRSREVMHVLLAKQKQTRELASAS